MMRTPILIAAFLSASVASAVPAAPVSPSRAASPAVDRKPVLPFIENDYPAALAAARARNLPIFVEAWAPW